MSRRDYAQLFKFPIAIVMGTLRGFPNPPATLRGRPSRPAPHARLDFKKALELRA
jgi:hypothetical protein